jgi:hypothetical protein
MPGIWTVASEVAPILTFMAPEDGWLVTSHIIELPSQLFVMAPDYVKVKRVGLTADVAETYAPLDVANGGQTPVPKPFLMIGTWVRTEDGWKMATDVALPIPPPPQGN